MSRVDKSIFALFICALLLILYREYHSPQIDERASMPRRILSLERSRIDLFYQKVEENASIDRYWGIAPRAKKKKKKRDIVSKTKEEKRGMQVKKLKGQNVLCINDSCYRLIGIYWRGEEPFVTLFHQRGKKRFLDYQERDRVEKSVIVQKIDTDIVRFRVDSTPKSLEFQLFDVNITKYQPKDKNATDF